MVQPYASQQCIRASQLLADSPIIILYIWRLILAICFTLGTWLLLLELFLLRLAKSCNCGWSSKYTYVVHLLSCSLVVFSLLCPIVLHDVHYATAYYLCPNHVTQHGAVLFLACLFAVSRPQPISPP